MIAAIEPGAIGLAIVIVTIVALNYAEKTRSRPRLDVVGTPTGIGPDEPGSADSWPVAAPPSQPIPALEQSDRLADSEVVTISVARRFPASQPCAAIPPLGITSARSATPPTLPLKRLRARPSRKPIS